MDHDSSLKPGHAKTYKFASQLSGRFFVSGISGSFSKHKKQLEDLESRQKRSKPKKFVNAPSIQSKFNLELLRDEERLHKLEERLLEVDRVLRLFF